MELTYAGKNGWAASASLEGGPNLAYSKSARTASLQGAAGQHFNVDDDQKGGGVNSLTQVGVSYTSDNKSLGMDAYNWQEDGANDKGMRVNFKLNF
jgi:putative surface-exposed virulence protein